MAKKGTAAAGKKGSKKGPKPGSKKFPLNTKTGATGDAALAGKAPEVPTIQVTGAGTLKSLLSTCRGLEKNKDAVVGKLREEIAYAKEKKGLNTGAFALLRKFDKMEAEAASELWHVLTRYLELAGVMAKIESVGRLPLDGEKADEDGDESGDGEAAEAAADAAAQHPKPAQEPVEHANGGKPAAEAGDANVTRPQFGRRQSQSEKAASIAAQAGGKPH